MIKPSVLYIEDNPYHADLVNAYLEHSPLGEFSVVWVKDLKDAVLQLDQHDFHIILLDFDLPRLDPFDSLRSLKHLGISSSIVIYTSLTESDRALESLKIGADDFLLKENIDPDSLAKSILFAYQRRQRTRALEETNSQLQKFVEVTDYTKEEVISPITNKDGEITHFVANKENVTEKKILSDKLEATMKRLERSSSSGMLRKSISLNIQASTGRYHLMMGFKHILHFVLDNHRMVQLYFIQTIN